MARAFLIFIILTSNLYADFLGFKTEDSVSSKLPALTEKLKNLPMQVAPSFEESFSQLVKEIEAALEQEKLHCSGESADQQGKVLNRDQKQLCFRDLKKNYLQAQEVIFDIKKKYLILIHNQQIEKLSEIQKKLKEDIEKSF
jgi:hypothetical protein